MSVTESVYRRDRGLYSAIVDPPGGLPQWVVIDPTEGVVAMFLFPEDAAAFSALTWHDANVYYAEPGSKFIWVWCDKKEAVSAAESYDRAAEIMRDRLRAGHRPKTA